MTFGFTSQSVANASINPPVPSWLAKYLIKARGPGVATAILQGQGYKCLPLGVVCWLEGSYDPPRWGKGTVTTAGPQYYLNARAWPATNAPIPRTFRNGWRLVIFCQTTGPAVNGRWGWTNVWDYVGKLGDVPMFVSDGFVYTGSNGFVAGDCASTNYGDG
ncbi:hypothetical protein [Amycolatopsis sp. NPDC051102]|uniref:hypothetical protein n=1 Tax=Amycolatopsis sp. NPDC051102 TaxID=3155163 RepID=UPI003417A175